MDRIRKINRGNFSLCTPRRDVGCGDKAALHTFLTTEIESSKNKAEAERLARFWTIFYLFIYLFMHYLTSISQAQQPKNSHIKKCVSSSELCNGNATATGVAYFECNHRRNQKITNPLWIFIVSGLSFETKTQQRKQEAC